jgi:hypothetical protein
MHRISYKQKYIYWMKLAYFFLALLILFITLAIIVNRSKKPLITPIATKVHAYKVKEEVFVENLDYWVGKYTDKYFETNTRRSEVRMLMHCLLHRESGHQAHDENGPHGDSGKAGGILQFHQPTWEGYRKKMMNAGLVEEIGSRYNPEQAIETTVWAISTGRAYAWGPVARDSKGSNFASCQTPSWY